MESVFHSTLENRLWFWNFVAPSLNILWQSVGCHLLFDTATLSTGSILLRCQWYEEYYSRQNGGEIPVFAGRRFQRGHGLESILIGFREVHCTAGRTTATRMRCLQHLVAEQLLYQPGSCLLDERRTPRTPVLYGRWHRQSRSQPSTDDSDRQKSGGARPSGSRRLVQYASSLLRYSWKRGAQLRLIDVGQRRCKLGISGAHCDVDNHDEHRGSRNRTRAHGDIWLCSHLSSKWGLSRFLPRCMECRRGIARRILSVRPSIRPNVRPSNAWIVTKRKKDLSRFLYHTKEHLA